MSELGSNRDQVQHNQKEITGTDDFLFLDLAQLSALWTRKGAKSGNFAISLLSQIRKMMMMMTMNGWKMSWTVVYPVQARQLVLPLVLGQVCLLASLEVVVWVCLEHVRHVHDAFPLPRPRCWASLPCCSTLFLGEAVLISSRTTSGSSSIRSCFQVCEAPIMI